MLALAVYTVGSLLVREHASLGSNSPKADLKALCSEIESLVLRDSLSLVGGPAYAKCCCVIGQHLFVFTLKWLL